MKQQMKFNFSQYLDGYGTWHGNRYVIIVVQIQIPVSLAAQHFSLVWCLPLRWSGCITTDELGEVLQSLWCVLA